MDNKNVNDEAAKYPYLYRGRRLGLVPANEPHFAAIYTIRSQVELAPFWQGRRRFPTQSEYAQVIKDISHNLFVVERLSNRKVIGFVYDYDMDPEDGYTFIASAMLVDEMEKGLGAEANWLFLHWLFDTYPLRKVYSEIYGYNQLSFSTTKSGGFKVEGCFLKHRFFQGQYWDMYRLAITRQEWGEIRQKFGKVFGRPDPKIQLSPPQNGDTEIKKIEMVNG